MVLSKILSILIDCCLSVLVMDDWKLKTMPVVRIERPNKTFVHFAFLFVSNMLKSRDGPKFGRRRSSAECSAQFGSATFDYSAEVRPNVRHSFGEPAQTFGFGRMS